MPRRHAGVNEATVTLSSANGMVTATIRDEGCGLRDAKKAAGRWPHRPHGDARESRLRRRYRRPTNLLGRGTTVSGLRADLRGRDAKANEGLRTMVRVLVVDYHEVVRAALKALLGASGRVDVVGEASSGEEAVRRVRTLEPDIVIIGFGDARNGRSPGDPRITALDFDTKILVLFCLGAQLPCWHGAGCAQAATWVPRCCWCASAPRSSCTRGAFRPRRRAGRCCQPQDHRGLHRPRQIEAGLEDPARHRALRSGGRAPAVGRATVVLHGS